MKKSIFVAVLSALAMGSAFGAMSERPQLFPYLQAAGIPYSRLHDVGGWMGQGLYVDIPNVFPDFDADENDPENYRFEATDRLIANLNKFGVEAFYRLGVTIENWTGDGMKGLRCYPPKDYAKWARICEHVIRHYNEGWANGYRFNLKYWEIWNEPDNNPDIKRNPMWQAPFEEYIKFYGVAATHLKAKFPSLRIGGYGSCGFYAIGNDLAMFANSSPQTVYFIDCAKQFLTAVKANGWPLDFFSFHSYSDPRPAMVQVRYADKILTEHGFPRGKCERIYNEWLPYAGQTTLGTAQQAVGIAAELIELQNGPCDVACLYDARCGIGAYSPLFNPLTYSPHKAYYDFVIVRLK